MCAVYVCLTLHVCLQFSVMIIQSASLHPKGGLNVQNCPQACKTWTADTHTHTRVHTDTHNLKQQYTQEAPGSQTKPGSLTFFGEMLDLLLSSANQAILGQPLCQTGLLHQKHSNATSSLNTTRKLYLYPHYIFECI